MWSASDLVQEITKVSELLAKRKEVGSNTDTMEKGMRKNLVSKIEKLATLSMTEAKEIYSAIGASNLSQDFQDELTEAVDSRLCQPTPENSASQPSTKTQLLTGIAFYLTERDWEGLTDPNKSLLARRSIIIVRLKKLGVKSLHEQTAKWCLAVLLATLSKLPDYHTIFDYLHKFKASFHEDENIPGSCFLVKYPNKPMDLPKPIWEAAYADAKPADPSPDRLDLIKHIACQHIPMRTTSKLLRLDQAPKGGKVKPDHQVATVEKAEKESDMLTLEGLNKKLDMMMNCWTMMMGCDQSRARGSGSKEIRLSPKRKALEDVSSGQGAQAEAFEPKKRLAIENAAQPALPDAAQPALPDSAKPTLPAGVATAPNDVAHGAPPAAAELDGNEFENAAYHALQAKKAQAKAKVKAAAKTKAKAKAKGAAKAIMKRPSAKSQVNAGEYQVPHPTKDDLALHANVYTSRCWHQAKSFALTTLEMDEDQAKEYARGKRAMAAELFKVKSKLAC